MLCWPLCHATVSLLCPLHLLLMASVTPCIPHLYVPPYHVPVCQGYIYPQTPCPHPLPVHVFQHPSPRPLPQPSPAPTPHLHSLIFIHSCPKTQLSVPFLSSVLLFLSHGPVNPALSSPNFSHVPKRCALHPAPCVVLHPATVPLTPNPVPSVSRAPYDL